MKLRNVALIVFLMLGLTSSFGWQAQASPLSDGETKQADPGIVDPVQDSGVQPADPGVEDPNQDDPIDTDPTVGEDPGAAAAMPDGLASLQISLESRSTLLGPTWKLDTPFITTGTTPNVIGYVSNNTAWAYSTANLLNLTLLPGAALTKGSTGQFDSCGAWMNSTYRTGSLIRAWYHSETDGPVCTSAPSKKAVGYAESTDGGRTYYKPNYPNNKVISAPSRFTDPVQASEADQKVIQVGNYLYMYFMAGRDYKVRLARSLVSDGGKPGTWWKYYNGSFSQPGLGGESTAIASGSVLGRAWVSYNTALGEYMGFSWSPTGFGISLSPDGINWRRVTGDILHTTHQFHNRNSSSPELLDYTSFIGLTGSPDSVGADMYLYYMRVPAGQPMVGDTRYLVRQKLRILNAPGGTPIPTPTAQPSATPTGGRTYTFTPQIDARVEQANPTRNFGTENYLRSNGGSEPLVESYMRFAVSGMAGTVQSAKLRVYSYNGTNNGPAIYATSGGWTETGITWNNKPGRTSGAYDDKGALGSNTWVEFNITPLVTGNNTYNFSMQQSTIDGFYVYSREGANRPQLVITTR
ncbi:MAG: DNRLRE domain-containing protein [Chloroflexota bacterium]